MKFKILLTTLKIFKSISVHFKKSFTPYIPVFPIVLSFFLQKFTKILYEILNYYYQISMKEKEP